MSDVDVIVVGHGLAGALLAHFLRRADVSFVVADAGLPGASSVAAGIINPISGQRFVRGAGVVEQLTAVERSYRQMEDELNASLFHPRRIRRILTTEAARARFESKWRQGGLDPFVAGRLPPGTCDGVRLPLGAVDIKGGSVVDLAGLVSACRARWLAEGRLLPWRVCPGEWRVEQGRVLWRDQIARCIVFCEGAGGLENSWTQRVGLRPVKGEILGLEWAGGAPDAGHILNWGKWLLQMPDRSWRMGATYQPDCSDAEPSEKGRAELVSHLREVVSGEFRICGHRAGVRLMSDDRLPRAGFYSDEPCVGIFNGLGSKGALLAPRVAEQLANCISMRTPIPL